ncbi:MAG TPA: carbon-nitrogen hydrolase family protein [Acidimicrobiia bacterium]|nr:carbon-nitrogen hydrolase family protein [Acidimicrobiia bacterium]
MGFRLALVQPLTHRPPDDERNVMDALGQVSYAASQGAEVVAFPETYPGPWRTPMTFDPTEAMAGAAKEHGVTIQFGTLEEVAGERRAAYNVLKLAGPDGTISGVYRRTHPPGPWIYTGGVWEFDYRVGDDYPVFVSEHGIVGLAMCSEAFMPEVARALALRGAEIIFMPAGIDKKKLWTVWRNLIWARASENLAVVITTQNLFDESERGLAMVAQPEEIVFESEAPGTFMIDVDLARIREMREQEDGPRSSEEYGAKPGVLTQWQRPEMRDKVYPTVSRI